jgi:hypothetical protein
MLFWQRIAVHFEVHMKCTDAHCKVPNSLMLEPVDNIRLPLCPKGLNHDLHSSHVELIKYSHIILTIKQCGFH